MSSIQFVVGAGSKAILRRQWAPTPGLISRTIQAAAHVVTLVVEVRRLCVLGVASHLAAGADPADGWQPIEERLPGEWGLAIRRLRWAAARLARRYDRAADWWVPPTLPQNDLTRGASSVVEAVLREVGVLLAHVAAVDDDPELAILHARSTFSWPGDEGAAAQAALRLECRQLLVAARQGALDPIPRVPGRPSEVIADACDRQARAELHADWVSLDHAGRVAALYRAFPEADPLPPARPEPPAITLPPPGSVATGAFVLSKPLRVPSLELLDVLRLLLENFPHPVPFAKLRKKHKTVHKALPKLVASDVLWGLALCLPDGQKGAGYRVRSVAEATRHHPSVRR